MFGEPRSVLFARFNVAEYRAHRISLLQLHRDLVDFPFARRCYAHHGFVRLDVDNFLIIRDLVAGLHFDINDCGFGD